MNRRRCADFVLLSGYNFAVRPGELIALAGRLPYALPP